VKYEKIISIIQSGTKDRAELSKMRRNAEAKLKEGDVDAQAVIDAIHISVPADDYILFIGFCPGGNVENRQDVKWKEKGICSFDYVESVSQMERFDSICAGDLVILKKREQFGKTMKLYGHGRVQSAVMIEENNNHVLKVLWSDQEDIIEVPLLGANSTVDIRTIERVEKEMPEEFFEWLGV